MKLTIIVAILALCLQTLEAQVSSATRASSKALVEYFSKKGAAREIARLGGESGIEKSLEAIAEAGGKKCLDGAIIYAKAHGLQAVKAIEISPDKVIRALDKTPPECRRNLIHIVNSNRRLVSENLKTGSEEFLVLEAKYPGFGMRISNLGDDVCKASNTLSGEDVFRIAQKSDALLRVKKASPKQYQKLVQSFKKAPSKTLDILEKHPKVLLSGTALAAFLSLSDETKAELLHPLKIGAYCVFAIYCAYLAFKLFRRKSGK